MKFGLSALLLATMFVASIFSFFFGDPIFGLGILIIFLPVVTGLTIVVILSKKYGINENVPVKQSGDVYIEKSDCATSSAKNAL